MRSPKIVRTPIEVARYHDMIDMILGGEVPSTIDDPSEESYKKELTVIKLVLCWLLGHDGQSYLIENMERLEVSIKELGFIIEQRNDLR